jgi:dihydroorotate dehydrogenase (fumarate)
MVRQKVKIPVAVKLSPFYTSLPHLIRQLKSAGASGVVLFNRFYQPDFDVRTREVTHPLHLSDSYGPTELRMRLCWMSILSPQTDLSLALTGGVHTGEDVVKGIMAGAHVTQIVSSLLRSGPEHLAKILNDMMECMNQIGAQSVESLRGSLNHGRSSDPAAFERGGYLSVIHSWDPASVKGGPPLE